MNKAILILLALAVFQATATDVNICGTGGWFSDPEVDKKSVTVVGCEKPPCRATKGELIHYSMKFTPTSVINDLTAHVRATRSIFHITILDGPSVCDKIFKASDNSTAPCPLSPGVEYIYVDAARVPTFLPTNEGDVELVIKSGSEVVKCVVAPAIID